MRSDKITFADINKIYVELGKDVIQQTVLSRRIRKIIRSIDYDEFKMFLKDKNLNKELVFFNEAISPLIRENATKFSYKSFCLICVFLLVEECSNSNTVRNKIKEKLSGDEYIDLCFNESIKKVDEELNCVVKISCENFDDTPENKKRLKRAELLKDDNLKQNRKNEILKNKEKDKKIFKSLLEEGLQISSNVLREYSDFLDEKSKGIDCELKDLTNKILNMNYKSKCKLKTIIEREIKKENDRFNKGKNNSELDKAMNKIAMRKGIDYADIDKLQKKYEYSFLKAMEASIKN
ncbi:TPA: hypothetical protein I9088_002175 [Clostridium perfringens]|nr:hypothetical protein [Clostridium perfringens]HAT4284270.1 hypothetical protein [Clostridium perfringens]